MAALALPWPWRWATLTWAHPGCPRTGPCADTGSNPGSRSLLAAHRPSLGKEGGRGRREAAPGALPGRRPGRNLPHTLRQGPNPAAHGNGAQATDSGPQLPTHSHPTYPHTAGGTGTCSCPRHPHRCPHWHTCAPHSRWCSPRRWVLQSQPGRSTCGAGEEGEETHGWSGSLGLLVHIIVPEFRSLLQARPLLHAGH